MQSMASAVQTRPVTGGKLEHILTCATRVFCEKGYQGASIRDISRLSGVSLAGLYYYFESKEELLYLIQKHCFTTLMERVQKCLAGLDETTGPEARLRLFIHNHVGYFLQNPEAMKVLSHEAESLGKPYSHEVAEIKRAYYRLCRGLLDDLKRERRLKGLDTRVLVMSLFGMMNWIYTWYNPRLDPGADALADHIAGLFLGGVLNGSDAVSGRNDGRKGGNNKTARTERSRSGRAGAGG